jgi:hypothetical protein
MANLTSNTEIEALYSPLSVAVYLMLSLNSVKCGSAAASGKRQVKDYEKITTVQSSPSPAEPPGTD